MIKLKHVFGGYEDTPIIEDVSFQVEQGQFFALLGPNGSGKTTLLKMMTGVLPVQKGEILLEERPIADYAALDRARLMTVLGQHEQIAFDFTVEEIIALGRYPHQKGFFKWLSAEDHYVMEEAMNLTDVLSYRHTPFRQLSGGEKQRALLAKVLAQEPRILLLDEPTNHLDIHHSFQMLTLLKEWQKIKQLTVFSILHDLNIASLYADQVGLLEEGRLVDIGDVSLLKKANRLESIYKVKVTSHAHPTIAKPQLLLSPEQDRKDDNQPFTSAFEIEQTEHMIHIYFPHHLKTLSNGVCGDGFQWAQHFCNFHVPKHYDSSDPQADLEGWLDERHIPVEQTIGMMTAVQLDDKVVQRAHEGTYSFLVVVTAGLGNAVDITQDTQPETMRKIGTINTMVFIDGHLTDGAFVNAVMSATEAKTKALIDMNVKDPQTETYASGTSTDSMLIAASQRGEMTAYAGSGTVLGKGIGKLVYQATQAAIKKNRQRVEQGR